MAGPGARIVAGRRRAAVGEVIGGCLAGALLLPVAPALADEAEKLQTVEVTGNYNNGVGTSDAASQGTVNAKLIENRPTLRPGEILEFVPGLIVSQHSGDGKANQYYLRGFNLDHGTDFATFVDGMPVNMRTHAHGQGYTDLNFLITDLVSQIDYRKGTYYADEGDFASAGAAHLRLANRLDRGIATLTGGENGYVRGLVANSNALGSGNLLYAVDASYNNGPWAVPEHARRTSGLLRYSQGVPGDGFAVTAMGYDAKWTSTDQIPLRAVDDGSLDRFGAIDPTDGGKTSRYSLSFDAVTSNDLGTLRFNAYAVASRLNLYNNFTYFLDDPVDGDQFEQVERPPPVRLRGEPDVREPPRRLRDGEHRRPCRVATTGSIRSRSTRTSRGSAPARPAAIG